MPKNDLLVKGERKKKRVIEGPLKKRCSGNRARKRGEKKSCGSMKGGSLEEKKK